MDFEKMGNLKEISSYYKNYVKKRKKGDLLKEYISQRKQEEQGSGWVGKSNYSQEKIAEYLGISVQSVGRMLSGENRKFEEQGEYEKELEMYLRLEPGSFDLESDQLARGYVEAKKQERPELTEEEILAEDEILEEREEQKNAWIKERQLQAIAEWCDRLELETCCLLAGHLSDYLNIPEECDVFLILYSGLEADDQRKIRKKIQGTPVPVSSIYNKVHRWEFIYRLEWLEKKDILAELDKDKAEVGNAGETTTDRERKVRERYKQAIQDGLKCQSYDTAERFYQWFHVYPGITMDEWKAMGEFYLANDYKSASEHYSRNGISIYQAGLLDEMLSLLKIKGKREANKNGIVSAGKEPILEYYVRARDGKKAEEEEGQDVQPD